MTNHKDNITPEPDAKPEPRRNLLAQNKLPLAILAGFIILAASNVYTGYSLAEAVHSTSAASYSLAQPAAVASGPAAAPQAPATTGQVALENAPVLGQKNAPLTLVDFSDYECPFCKQFATQVLPQLKKDYIDTGKMNLVFKNFPLSFHQNAHKEAEAAECARDQGGDNVYFKFHDEMYSETTSNGTGLALTQLPVIAKKFGLNVPQFQQCLDSGKYTALVDKDEAEGTTAGVSGTPSFFVGKADSNGIVKGPIIVGAQPLASFKTAIEQALASQ